MRRKGPINIPNRSHPNTTNLSTSIDYIFWLTTCWVSDTWVWLFATFRVGNTRVWVFATFWINDARVVFTTCRVFNAWIHHTTCGIYNTWVIINRILTASGHYQCHCYYENPKMVKFNVHSHVFILNLIKIQLPPQAATAVRKNV
jgi:hypothetical protein